MNVIVKIVIDLNIKKYKYYIIVTFSIKLLFIAFNNIPSYRL